MGRSANVDSSHINLMKSKTVKQAVYSVNQWSITLKTNN